MNAQIFFFFFSLTTPLVRAVLLSPGKFGVEFHTVIFCSHPLGATPSSSPATFLSPSGKTKEQVASSHPTLTKPQGFFLNICSSNHYTTGVASSLALIPNPWGKSLHHALLEPTECKDLLSILPHTVISWVHCESTGHTQLRDQNLATFTHSKLLKFLLRSASSTTHLMIFTK